MKRRLLAVLAVAIACAVGCEIEVPLVEIDAGNDGGFVPDAGLGSSGLIDGSGSGSGSGGSGDAGSGSDGGSGTLPDAGL